MVGAPRAPPLEKEVRKKSLKGEKGANTHVKPLNMSWNGGPEIGPGR